MSTTDTMQDVVISTRVRLARNLDDLYFPPRMGDVRAAEVVTRVADAMAKLPDSRQYALHRLCDVTGAHAAKWMEHHLISPLLMERADTAAVMIRGDNTVSIMINEEDHLRIQALLPGFQLREAFQIANEIDDGIEKSCTYAFSERWGYLTACPSNAGTGMRASAMMHLPALTMSGQMNTIINALGKVGLTVRGMYGEGSEAQANMYQFSNQVTLGCSEEDIISALTTAVMQVVERERSAREAIYEKRGIELEDHICRSLGILQSARHMDSKEFMQLLSSVRLGLGLKLITGISLAEVDALFVEMQPGSLVESTGKESPQERDTRRATLTRAALRCARPAEDTAKEQTAETKAKDDDTTGHPADDIQGGK